MITVNEIGEYDDNDRVLVRADGFIYLAPSPKLADVVSNYSITFPTNCIMSNDYTVVPHGCATLVYAEENEIVRGDLFGSMLKRTTVGEKANKCQMIFIIELQPVGLAMLTGLEQKPLVGKIVPFEPVNVQLHASIIKTVEQSTTIKELIDTVEDALFLSQCSACPPSLKLATGAIIEHMGNISNAELTKIAASSERQLSRIFNQYLGMSIKAFSRLVRVNKAIKLLYDPINNITDVCYLSGFYDLAHFIHDFKSVCGVTPQEYRNKMADFYNEVAKY